MGSWRAAISVLLPVTSAAALAGPVVNAWRGAVARRQPAVDGRDVRARSTVTSAAKQMVSFETVADVEARGRTFEAASYIFYAVGAAGAVAGAVLVVLKPGRASVSASLVPSPGGLAVRGSF